MKVEIGKKVDTNVASSVEFSISKNASKLFALLGTYLYSQKEECVLHELSSNATDAHKMVGKEDQPIKIFMPTRLDPALKIRDFGPGLSNDNVFKFLTTYGESNKQDSNEFIGGWGIGSKSPAAVSDTWKISSYHEGMLTEYLVFINGDGIPSLTTIRSVPTNETGLEVSIPIPDSKFHTWQQAVQKVYVYYKVTPEIVGYSGRITSGYPKPEHKTGPDWWIATGGRSYGYSTCNLIASNRNYSIDKDKISSEIPDSESALRDLLIQPICMEMAIGQVELSVSREQLQYTKKTVDAIIARLREIYSQFKTRFDDAVSKHTNELEYRECIVKYLTDNFSVSPSSLDAMKFVLHGFINGKYNIRSANDLSRICFGLTATSAHQVAEYDFRVSNMGTVKRINHGFTCWKTYSISAVTTYDRSTNVNRFDLQFSIAKVKEMEFYLADSNDTYARIRHYQKSNAIAKRFIFIAKSLKDIPVIFHNKFVKASTLPKAPRAVAAKKGIRADSDVYVVYQNSYDRVKFDTIDKSTAAYVLTKNYISTGGIDSKELKLCELYKSNSFGKVIAVKDAALIPKGHDVRTMLEKAATALLNSDKHKKESLMYIRDILGQYLPGGDAIYAIKLRTPKKSVWNDVMEKYAFLSDAPQDSYFDRYHNIRGKVNQIYNWLGIKEVDYTGADTIKADLTKIKETYTMIKYFGPGISWKTKQVRDDMMEYINSVGK